LKNGIGGNHQDSFKFQVSSFKSEQSPMPKVVVRDHFELWTLGWNDYAPPMALARILVDGYSLLHNWPELAPGRPRHSARVREELVHVLTRYHDATGTPVTIFFDGSGAPAGTPTRESNPVVEVLFSCAGQTADDMIERAAHRFRAYGEVLAVTDDVAERDTVTGMGGLASSCANFIRMVENALTELQDELQSHNQVERNRFNRSHKRDLK
jgi:predicted RNA-binding protein with PIN domain